MNQDELNKVIAHIKEHHWLIKGRNVKYLDLSYDFRTETYWKISIRGFGMSSGKVFTHTNASEEYRKISLFDHVMNWLKEVEK